MSRLYFCALILIAASTTMIGQTAGTIDSTFGVNGIASASFSNGLAYGGGVRQPDGKLIVTGYTDGAFAAARFTDNGALDSTYGTNGKSIVAIGVNDIPYGCALQPDGKLVVVGTSTLDYSDYNFAAVRLNSDGSLDHTFGTNGKTVMSYPGNNEAHAVIVQSDGKILIAGFSAYTSSDQTTIPLLARLTSNGIFDNTFNNGNGWSTYTGSAALGYYTWIYAIALQSDGKILIGGTSNTTGFGTTFAVFRFNSTGTMDNTFDWSATRYADGLNAGGIAYALAVQLDGKIIAAGVTHDDFYICRFNTTGSLDNTFGNSSLGVHTSLTSSNTDRILSCVIQDDGKILVAGAANYNFGLARYNSDGSLDNTFGSGGTVVTELGDYDEIYSVVTKPDDGKIIALGRSGDNFVAAQYYGYQQTAVQPTVQSSSITSVLATQTTATVRWTKGNGASRILIARVDNAVSASPVDGHSYTANATYGSGTNLGSSNYVVYDGTDSVVTLQGLIVGKTYYYAAFEYNGTGNSKTYLQTNPATGSYTVTPLAGFDGSSYVVKFDGTDDCIANTSFTQGTGPFTVEAWVWTSTSNLPSAGIFNRAGNTSSRIIWKFNLNNNNVRIDFYNTSIVNKTVISTAIVKDNQWHHIAGGYDGTNIFLYVDGNLQGTTSFAGGTLNTSAAPLVIGYDSCCSGRPFNGMIAELRIWNAARTQAEIRDNMHLRIPANNPSLLAYYHFADASGSTTYDSVSATSASLINFNYNANSGFIKSNPPFGLAGGYVASSGTETSIGASGSQAHATILSSVDSINTIGLYSFGTPSSLVSDVPALVADERSQLTWGVQKKGALTDTTQIVFDYSGTRITPPFAKLLTRASAAAVWADASSLFVHDQVNRTFSKTGSTSSAEYSIGTSNEDPLPVEIKSFTVTATESSARLIWSTATEINNAKFEVERLSIAGKQAWMTVGSVAGSGTSNTPKEYSFTDNNLFAGKYSYRLKQIDRNGKFSYTNEAEVVIAGVPKVFALEQNYPNPFNPTTKIGFTLQVSGITTLKVYDAVGKEVATLVNENLEAGAYHEAIFDASRLASGVYLARLQSGGRQLMRKMLMLK